MKTIVILLFAIVLQTTFAATGLKTFSADFTVTASQYNHGFFNGQVYYDYTQYAFLLTFPVADEYSELYIYNSGCGYNTQLLNGQFSGQYLYKNSSVCLCETTNLLSSMPLFFLDATITANNNPIWIPDSSPQGSPVLYQGQVCNGYVVNPGALPNLQEVTYFWQTAGGTPCGFTFVDGRTFTFTNVKSSSVAPIPTGRFNPPVDCKCGKPLDVVLSLDRTGSIMIWEWYIQHNFTQNLCAAFDYGPLKTNLGIVDWNSNFWTTLAITDGVSADVVNKAVAAMTCCVTTTNIYASCCCCGTPIGGGLYYAAQMMLTSTRPTATKIIILLTDGCQNHMYDPSVNPPAVTACVCSGTSEQSCQTDVPCIQDINTHYDEVTEAIPGIKIIVVGVGNSQQICTQQLLDAAGGQQQYVYQPQSWQDLSNLVQSISATACTEGEQICTGCCGICSCGSCIKPLNCSAPDKCSVATVDSTSGCCTVAPLTCPPKPCFTVACDPLVGCVYTNISCPASDNCTTWGCDEDANSFTFGSCKITSHCSIPQCTVNSNCNDNNKCTNDICTNNTCYYTQAVCGVSDNCTTYTCDPILGCKNTSIVCNDFNLCTKDTCNGKVKGGCVYAPITCNKTLDACYNTFCSPIAGCYSSLKPCNLTTNNCTIVACVNGTCGRTNICLPPPAPSGSELSQVVLIGTVIGTAAVIGIIVGAIALIAGLVGGGAAAFAHAGAAGGASFIANNPLYADTTCKGTSPLYKPA